MRAVRWQQVKGLLLGGGATVLWASFYPTGRYLFGEEAEAMDVLWLTFLRLELGAAGFLLYVLFRQGWRRLWLALRVDWRLFAGLCIIGVAAESCLIFLSLSYTTAARSSLIANTSPIMTAILAYLVLKEEFTRHKVIGMVLGFAGVAGAMLSRGGDIYGGGEGFWIGDLLALAAGFSWSVYTVWGEGVTRRHGSALATAVLLGGGGLSLLPLMLISGSQMTLAMPPRVWLGTIYLGVMTGGVANAMWLAALRVIPPGRLGALGYVSCSLTLILSVWLLQERVTPWFVLALLMVVAGVYLMMSGKAVPDVPESRPAESDG
ncbi:MAG TPA: DMT family transporter [Lentisphaeria bacterium]|nr:DMT family transporter [Lentisphaerota bacterium]OQC16584.1 MAG: putative DMT superfamily transporter inner membrane protein [Lentisphaerae bacterium ADurb.Bin082]HPY89186.1 DMT family transporter [Lentisphaeria bacterium]HQC51987.1 DMT family transporter [Lentisphaeria bacterium]HQL88445.1 DMT family transporter [Lentisphaeria bacterium]